MPWGLLQNDAETAIRLSLRLDISTKFFMAAQISRNIINADVERHRRETQIQHNLLEEKKKKDDNIVLREILRPWGRISAHVGDKSLFQGIFRASLKEIELPDLGEQKEEAEYRCEIWDFELRGVRRER